VYRSLSDIGQPIDVVDIVVGPKNGAAVVTYLAHHRIISIAAAANHVIVRWCCCLDQ
jgi:predicted CoA-binding protein